MCRTFTRYAILTVVLLWFCFLFVAPATATTASKDGKVPLSLEQAIGIARQSITVPAEFTQFSSEYSTMEGEATWNLRWYSEGSRDGNLYVAVSATRGEVLSMHQYKSTPSGAKYSVFPKYSRQEAQRIAADFAGQVQPGRFASTQLVNDKHYINPPLPGPRYRDYPVTYYVHFQRLHKGIPVADNGIYVEVDGETGEIRSLNLRWDKDEYLPPAGGRISPERARQIFDQEALELVYVYTGSRERDTGERPYLVYRVREGGFFLDALTGKLIDPEGDFYFMGSAGGMGDEMARKLSSSLTPQEAAVVDEIKGLLTVEAARQAAEKAFPLPAGVQFKHSQLTFNWNAPGNKVWHLGYTAENEKITLNLAVDAQNGSPLRYNIYRQQDPAAYYQQPEVKFSQEQAQKIAQDFIKRLQPNQAGQVSLRNTSRELGPVPRTGEPLPRSYTFNYARQVNGIPYTENGFSVTVNSTTGEVTGYSFNWWDTSFPGAGGILNKERANNIFINKDSIKLEYSRFFHRWREEMEQGRNSYKVMYHLGDRANIIINARTGQETNLQGEPIIEPVRGFTDIAGHPAEQDIMLLAEAGIITGKDNKFRPDDEITSGELVTMLVAAYNTGYHFVPLVHEDDSTAAIMAYAVNLGILDAGEQINTALPATRLQTARLLINAQGYGPLARLSSLFKLETADANAIPEHYRGYAASAVGLKMLPLEDGKFNPDATITRGNLAQILVRSLLVSGR